MYDRLVRLLTEELDIDPALISPQVSFRDLALDSMTLVEFAVMVTEETGTVVQDVNLDVTLAEAAAQFTALQNQSQAPV